MSRDPVTRTRPAVLIVEDEEMLRDLACMMFDEAGFDVLTASNGSEAIEALKTKPDIGAVFTDVHMPGQPDGIELARHVREVCPDCAIIVVSGRGVKLPDLGERVRYFNKPFEVDRVVGTMRALMGLGGPAR